MDAHTSLREVFRDAGVMDRRRTQGLRHPLEAILTLTCVAIMCGVRTQSGVVQFGNAYGLPFLRLLGFHRRRGPSEATLSRVMRCVDADALEALISRWVGARSGSRRYQHIAIDGKTLRGSREGNLPGVHLLSGYASELGATLAQLRVDSKTNEYKAALELLGVLPLQGKVVTGDAMFTHRDVCTLIRERGGDYVLPAKANQKNLLRDIKAAFNAPPAGLSPPTEGVAIGELREGLRAGQGARPDRTSDDRNDDLVEWLPRLA